MSIDYNSIIIETILGITPEELSDTIRSFYEKYENHTSYIDGVIGDYGEEYAKDFERVLSDLSVIRKEVEELRDLSNEIIDIIEKIDKVNEFNQVIYLSEDFIQVINEIREILDDDLLTMQDHFIFRIEDMEEELDERKEISYEELEEIEDEISDILREIELDSVRLWLRSKLMEE